MGDTPKPPGPPQADRPYLPSFDLKAQGQEHLGRLVPAGNRRSRRADWPIFKASPGQGLRPLPTLLFVSSPSSPLEGEEGWGDEGWNPGLA